MEFAKGFRKNRSLQIFDNTSLMEHATWQLKFWRIPLTKSGEPQTIPLTDEAIKVLKALKEADNNPSPWVFPSATSASGHFMDPKKAWQRLLKNASLQDLRIHDLRRTLILADVYMA